MSVQTVDATPSGIKLFSKEVFIKQGKRFGLSAEQKSDVWRRWKSGQTLHEIGRAFGKEHSSIRCLVSRHGGIAPALRRRALLALTLREREEISRGLASGVSNREIDKCLKRAVSTVSREVARHGGRPAYRASQADDEAWQSALRPKRCLLSINLKLRNIVASKLILDWSPKQISRLTGHLRPRTPRVRLMQGPRGRRALSAQRRPGPRKYRNNSDPRRLVCRGLIGKSRFGKNPRRFKPSKTWLMI